jgi:hypothetical protein
LYLRVVPVASPASENSTSPVPKNVPSASATWGPRSSYHSHAAQQSRRRRVSRRRFHWFWRRCPAAWTQTLHICCLSPIAASQQVYEYSMCGCDRGCSRRVRRRRDRDRVRAGTALHRHGDVVQGDAHNSHVHRSFAGELVAATGRRRHNHALGFEAPMAWPARTPLPSH